MSASCSRKHWATLSEPLEVAWCNGVLPRLSASSIENDNSNSSQHTVKCPLAVAQWRGVLWVMHKAIFGQELSFLSVAWCIVLCAWLSIVTFVLSNVSTILWLNIYMCMWWQNHKPLMDNLGLVDRKWELHWEIAHVLPTFSFLQKEAQCNIVHFDVLEGSA